MRSPSLFATDFADDLPTRNISAHNCRIVYVAAKEGEPCHLFVMPVPSGLAREIGRCLTEERSRADWDAEGQAVYFSDRPAKDAVQRIYRLDIAIGKRSEFKRPRNSRRRRACGIAGWRENRIPAFPQ